jgi:hypothetical protein
VQAGKKTFVLKPKPYFTSLGCKVTTIQTFINGEFISSEVELEIVRKEDMVYGNDD